MARCWCGCELACEGDECPFCPPPPSHVKVRLDRALAERLVRFLKEDMHDLDGLTGGQARDLQQLYTALTADWEPA